MLQKLYRTIKVMLGADGAKGQRFSVLMKFIYVQLRFLFQKEFVYNWINNTRIFIVQHRSASTECVYYKLFDPEEMSIIRDQIRQGDVFIDVGANIGGYSVYAASYGAEVYAFEPVASTFDLLKRNISLNPQIEDRIHPVRKVVSNTEGEVAFTTDCDTTNKVVDANYTKASGVTVIPTVTLDSAVAKANILKIDVEGYEKYVLAGARKILSSPDLRLIVLEDPDEEIISLLATYGFAQCRYDSVAKGVIMVDHVQNKQNGIFVKNL